MEHLIPAVAIIAYVGLLLALDRLWQVHKRKLHAQRRLGRQEALQWRTEASERHLTVVKGQS